MAKKITINQVGVMVETLGDKVKAIAEGQNVLTDEVRRIDQKIDKVHASLKNEIKTTGMALNSKIEENKIVIKKVSDTVDKIDHKLDQHIKLPSHV